MKGRIIAVAALALTIASVANAALRVTDRAQRWDLSVETRYTDSHTFDGANNTKLALDDDLGWGFQFGYNVNERFNIGFLMSWRSISYTATYYDATDQATALNYGGWLDTGTFAALGQFNLLPKTFTPYVNGGIGWTLIDTNIVADYYTGCWWDPWWGYICDGFTSTYGTDTASFLVGVGVRFEPSEVVFIQAGYEKAWLDDASTDGFNMVRICLGFTN
jgi:opacity protein-like surface antigen